MPRMLRTPLLTALLLAAPAVAQQDPVALTPEGPLPRAAFGEWLVATHGHAHVEDFVAERRLLAEAEARGLLPGEERVREVFEREEAIKVREFHDGDRARYEQQLLLRGWSPERWAEHRLERVRVEETYRSVAAADRVITDEQVEREFRARYGPGAERTDVEILFFSAFADAPQDGRPDLAAGKQAAKARAEAARAALEAGATMRSLADDADSLDSPFVTDRVRVDGYRENALGRAVDHAVHALDRPGEISPPVERWDGYALVRLVERTPVTLRSVREDLVAELEARPPSSGDIVTLRQRLLEEEGVEILIRDG